MRPPKGERKSVHLLVKWPGGRAGDQSLKTITTLLAAIRTPNLVLAGVAHWIEHGLQTKGSLVQFPVRAHA